MANEPVGQLHVLRTRLARLDPITGAALPGASNAYVSDALVELNPTLNYTDGEQTRATNAAGVTCVRYDAPDSFDNVTADITWCTPDPYVMEFLGTGAILTDTAAIGWAAPPIGPQNYTFHVSIEMWTRRVDASGAPHAARPYGWHVFPRVTKFRMNTPGTFGASEIQPSFQITAIDNPAWGNGPFNDWPVATPSNAAYLYLPTAMTLPVVGTTYVTVPVQT
jgi:hypothetical protein